MNVKGLRERTAARGDMAEPRLLPARPKGVDLAERTIEVVASTNQVDREGEIIHPEAFRETLPGFLASNAPLLSAHTHRSGDVTPTQVGWVMDAAIEKTRVTMRVRFAETGPAEDWWAIASDPGGKGIAVSIGFRALRYVVGTAEEIGRAFPDLRASIREAGLKDEDRLVVFTAIELYELSCVPVPANRLALQIRSAMQAIADGGEARDGAEALAGAIGEAVRAAVRDALPAAEAPAPGISEAPDLDAVQSTLETLESKIDDLTEVVAGLTPDLVGLAAAAPSPAAADPAPAAGEGDDGDAVRGAARALRNLTRHA